MLAAENRNCTVGFTCLSDARNPAVIAMLKAEAHVASRSKSRASFELLANAGNLLPFTGHHITDLAGVQNSVRVEHATKFAHYSHLSLTGELR